jgi:site-specific recombinase XerD
MHASGEQRPADVTGVSGLHPHELRHMAASLAISSGADVNVVQQMLGHNTGFREFSV